MLSAIAQLVSFLTSVSGKDASEAFEDVGHSDEARSLLKDLRIGEFEKNGVCDLVVVALNHILTLLCLDNRRSSRRSLSRPMHQVTRLFTPLFSRVQGKLL